MALRHSVLVSLVLLCAAAPAPTLRQQIAEGQKQIVVPPGITVLHSPLELPPGAQGVVIRGANDSVLRLAPDFHGSAAITGAGLRGVRLEGFRIEGNRTSVASNVYLPPDDVPFASWYTGNGILFRDSHDIAMVHIGFRGVRSFPILLNHCAHVTIESVDIADSGTLNSAGHSNTTGGILIEEGSTWFTVRWCVIHGILGNGIWTHSDYGSRKNEDGVIEQNSISDTPRDAIQVGQAIRVRVAGNSGSRIGYPAEAADLPGAANPVAIDTSGDVAKSTYIRNRFTDVNGKCIDLDGFHDGEVAENSCVNQKPIAEYPLLHGGIIFGNTNPDMKSQNIVVRANLIQGFAYGGAYVIGEHQRIVNNRFVDVNRAHCTGDMTVPRCNYAPEEPGMLRSGIYLARGAGRPAVTRDNVIRDNYVSGFGMDKWCIEAAPGVSLAANEIAANTCVPVK